MADEPVFSSYAPSKLHLEISPADGPRSRKHKNQYSEKDTVPTESPKVVARNKAEKPVHDKKRTYEGNRRSKHEPRRIVERETVPRLPKVVRGSSENCRDGKEKGKFGRSLARKANHHSTNDRGTGTACTRNHRKTLHEAHQKRVLPRHIVHGFNASRSNAIPHAALNPQNDESPDNERRGDRDGIEKILFDGSRNKHANQGGRQECDDGIDSKVLLRKTVGLIAAKGYSVGNVDATICAERPKMNPHIPAMRQCLASVMGIDEDDVSVKATTTERLGYTGREEGISAYAVALIEKRG